MYNFSLMRSGQRRKQRHAADAAHLDLKVDGRPWAVARVTRDLGLTRRGDECAAGDADAHEGRVRRQAQQQQDAEVGLRL